MIPSGGGIKQIEAKTVTFGATDAPLKGPELDKFGLVQFPGLTDILDQSDRDYWMVHADLGLAACLWMFAAPAADIRSMSVGGSCCIDCAIAR